MLINPPVFLDGDPGEGEEPCALAVLQVDGMKEVQISVIVGQGDGWMERRCGAVVVFIASAKGEWNQQKRCKPGAHGTSGGGECTG